MESSLASPHYKLTFILFFMFGWGMYCVWEVGHVDNIPSGE